MPPEKPQSRLDAVVNGIRDPEDSSGLYFLDGSTRTKVDLLLGRTSVEAVVRDRLAWREKTLNAPHHYDA